MSDRSDRATRYGVTALAILGGLGVVGVIAITGMIIAGEWSRRPEMPRTVQARTGAQTFTIGSAVRIAGSSLVRLTLSTGSGEGNPYGSSPQDEDRNILILDTVTGKSRRLLSDNSRHIVSSFYLPAAASGKDDREARDLSIAGSATDDPTPEIFYCLEIERRDGKLRDVLVGRIDGGPAVTVLEGTGGIDPPWMLDARRAAVIVRERGRLVYRTIDMEAQTATAAVPIEIGQ